jgi:phage shock protein A
MPVVSISPVLRDRLSDQGAEELVRLLSLVEESSSQQALTLAEERFARRLAETEMRFERRLAEELGALEGRLNQRFADMENRIVAVDQRVTALDKRLTEEVARVRTELADVRADILKWMFLFWIGQTTVMATLLYYFRH